MNPTFSFRERPAFPLSPATGSSTVATRVAGSAESRRNPGDSALLGPYHGHVEIHLARAELVFGRASAVSHGYSAVSHGPQRAGRAPCFAVEKKSARGE